MEVDEIWSFVYACRQNVAAAKAAPDKAGDVWTWTAFDPDTKLILTWYVGNRSGESALAFMGDVRARIRLGHRVQITSDGHHAYLDAVKRTFRKNVDYAMLVKTYRKNEKHGGRETYVRSDRTAIRGEPNPALISTSGVERNNLTMRMGMRRFARRTNAFSKKIENHACALALRFAYYNFCRLHRSIGATRAMAAGVTDRIMEMSDLVDLTENSRPNPRSRWP